MVKIQFFSVCHGCFTIQGAVYSGQDSLQKNMRPGNKVKDAQTELSKFNFYLSEGEKLWSRSRPLVESRKFFELWESLHHPEPFLLEDTPFSLAGYRFELPEKEKLVCEFLWSEPDNCAALEITGCHCRMLSLLRFIDGRLTVKQLPAEYSSDENTSELYDLLYQTAKKWFAASGHTDIKKMKRKDFAALLSEASAFYPPRIVSGLRKLSLDEIHAQMEKVLADNALDELGNQLLLPLFGSYSQEEKSGRLDEILLNPVRELHADTPWRIERRMELLQKTAALMLEFERRFTLSFASAEAIGCNGDLQFIRLKPPEDIPVCQDDLLNIFTTPPGTPAGVFKVDYYDGEQIIGSLGRNIGEELLKEPAAYTGTLQRGPSELYLQQLRQMRKEIETGQAQGVSGMILGAAKATFQFPDEAFHAPPQLDAAQAFAWSTAIHSGNRCVLIQGPPGTGKTHVLEKIVRTLSRDQGQRILIAATSHAAVDNICRRIPDLPYLRCGRVAENIARDIAEKHWIGIPGIYGEVYRNCHGKGIIFAGTHATLLKDAVIQREIVRHGLFDTLLIDEAGMANAEETLLCTRLAARIILLGDHRQLPPFPRPAPVLDLLFGEEGKGTPLHESAAMVTCSAMEWLIRYRKCPVIVLNKSYRCRNPRLLRFASSMFYGISLHPDRNSEYYRLSAPEREKKYPPSTLRWISTSNTPRHVRHEFLDYTSGRPGLCNPYEIRLCIREFENLLKKYPLHEISLISPYNLQIRKLRNELSRKFRHRFSEDEWNRFLFTRVSTVDSFQGGESDAVIISYVRSNSGAGIGFTDNPNRINVAYTRCRDELVIIGDLDCLKNQDKNGIFPQMERAFLRDGEIMDAEFFAHSDAPAL